MKPKYNKVSTYSAIKNNFHVESLQGKIEDLTTYKFEKLNCRDPAL